MYYFGDAQYNATHSLNSQNYKNKLKIEDFFALFCVSIDSKSSQ
ncbi:hypothetical protein HFN_0005 [Helicobacter fennelliae MRY12-0050]|uniref:Uncharacterized protein n=1 Tax=Helicobacter fennelliae MRY12-0050 TaxID=1325130 RepID=T1CQ45_9HELI|nr:hypothetical protein HFN_0005 [Helicobacter fennelliae MRY12-0050]